MITTVGVAGACTFPRDGNEKCWRGATRVQEIYDRLGAGTRCAGFGTDTVSREISLPGPKTKDLQEWIEDWPEEG